MKEVYIHVTFGHGPLGIVINYSNHGTIIVTEFSSDNGVMGQAQASGKIFIGDEIFSVNGNYLETIAQSEHGVNLRRQAQNAASVFDYAPPQAPNAAYNNLADNLNPFPFDATQNQPSGTMAPVSYGMAAPSGFLKLLRAKAEAVAVTSLSDSQIEQWIKLYSQQVHHQPSRLTVATSGSGAHGSNAQVGRQNNTPKRKHAGGSATPSSPSAAERPTRKRKNNAGSAGQPQFVELRCYQMKTPTYQFHLGVVDATLKQRLDLILTTLLKNELALAFTEPVNPKYVPGYTDIIKNPMDLGTIKSRIGKGYYEQRPEQVTRDVNLVWENCFTFNRLDAEISKCANRLRYIWD
uniref:Bromo domain-containing protein n=1 Tax=Globisporangium ultimum (strain ATCC 200006 / CBS 805.95 / DAOM BR144) TaxID=431595 RepID=K3W5V2_GLOUD